jgi:hypothetical protein
MERKFYRKYCVVAHVGEGDYVYRERMMVEMWKRYSVCRTIVKSMLPLNLRVKIELVHDEFSHVKSHQFLLY